MSSDTQSLASLDVSVVMGAINSLKEQMTKLNKHIMRKNQQMVTTACGPWSVLFSPEKCRYSVSRQTNLPGRQKP